jgi:hypothetical protein
MKYIDAEKLKAEIERRKQVHFDDYFIKKSGNSADYGASNALVQVLSLIASLQQEQESVAERFARIVRGNLIGIDKDVQQKFEQLYFEITGNKMYGGYND